MNIDTLEQVIRANARSGIPFADAEQLVLWLYCTEDVLPTGISPPTRDELEFLFARLAHEGVICAPNASTGTKSSRTTRAEWGALITDLLNGEIVLDESFPQRIGRYLGPME